ncbi:hypothetical protein GCM10027019_01060 [Melaminivora jejuensis]
MRGKLAGVACSLIVQCRHRLAGAALGDDAACRGLAAAALGSDAEFELDLVKTHPGARMAGNLAVGNTVADANDHGWGAGRPGWLGKKKCREYK